MTVAEWIRRNRRWRPDKLAVVSGKRRFTYAAFDERVNRQANGLAAAGLARGDRVAVLGNNSAEALECVGAAAKGGYVHVPISFRLSPREVGQILAHSGARILFIENEFADRLEAAGTCPELERIVRFDPNDASASEYEAWLAAQSAAEPLTDAVGDDDFLIVYTSGTTGAPKGALFQQRQSVAHAPVAVLLYEIREDSRLLMVYPHNSIASVNMFYVPAWMVGATVVLADARNFSAERWLKQVQDERITHCHLVPTMLFRVLESDALRRFDFSSLQTVGYGSAPMPRERVERLSEVFGNILVQGYGMTEVSSLASVLTKAEHAQAVAEKSDRLGSCGRPAFGCELRVVDPLGKDVGPGEIGEIIFRGPQLTAGYWRDPARTAEAIRNGWLHSGDLAKVDDRGYIYIVDRKSDIIISGGANVSSKEVEEVIYWHEAVKEAAVVGRPDAEWGERVHAFVVLHPDANVTERELIDFCRMRLAHWKCPDAIEFLGDLPRNALGKFMKAELRARLRRHAEKAS